MRTVKATEIADAVCRLFSEANRRLPEEACDCIRAAAANESSPVGRAVLHRLVDNLDAAAESGLPICQDTGMAVIFAEIGQDVHIDGGFEDAVNDGVRRAYLDGLLRCSIVRDPLFDRVNTGDNTPAMLHTRLVPGENIRLVAAPKGFGSENMSALRMFTPSATREDIIGFVVETVRRAGGNPCPPVMVGVGIGGNFEGCALLAKRALTRTPGKANADERYAALERDMLAAVNALGIGPQGFGGDTTALAVAVESAPTHIAGLPVAVNINCHVMRHAEALL